MSVSIIKETEPHQTESLANAWGEFTEGKLRNTLTYLPRFANEELFAALGNKIKGEEKYRLTNQIGNLTTKLGKELSYAFKRQREEPKLKVVHNTMESADNNTKIAA